MYKIDVEEGSLTMVDKTIRDAKDVLTTVDGLLTNYTKHLLDLEAEVKHWKANHANMVERSRVLMERPDLPIERVQAFNKWGEDKARIEQLEARVKELEARLEFNAEYPPYDGIYCRDATIALLEGLIEKLRKGTVK